MDPGTKRASSERGLLESGNGSDWNARILMINYFAIGAIVIRKLLRREHRSMIFVFEDTRGTHETKDSHASSLIVICSQLMDSDSPQFTRAKALKISDDASILGTITTSTLSRQQAFARYLYPHYD